MKNFLKFIFSRFFLKQLFLAVVLAAVLFVVVFIALCTYTYHGKTVQVPDLQGYNEKQVVRVIADDEFRYEIIDSVYTNEVLPGTVFDQVPDAGVFVKKGRKIFIVINALGTEMVSIPSLQNVSLRQARVLLQEAGLKVGELIYVPSDFKGLVLDQMMNDAVVYAGTKVPKGTAIDVRVGKGLGNVNVAMPYLRGMYWIDAEKEIGDLSLNIGSVIEDSTMVDLEIKDSAIVWKQYPQPDVVIRVGKGVDVWLTMDTAVVYAADTTLRVVPMDSLVTDSLIEFN